MAEAASAECARSVEQLRAEAGGRRIVLRVDRVEPSKNIVRGMLAFEELLVTYPEWRDKVVHIALVYPSRQGLADYLAYGAEVTYTAERINHAWGTANGTPVVLHVEDDRPRSLAALTISDVLLVNPVRDGLNLVAKEGALLNGADGVLVLSREAGAWEELSEAALGVNPFDVSATADALHQALSMDAAERRRRGDLLRSLVLARNAADWLDDQLAAARAARSAARPSPARRLQPAAPAAPSPRPGRAPPRRPEPPLRGRSPRRLRPPGPRRRPRRPAPPPPRRPGDRPDRRRRPPPPASL